MPAAGQVCASREWEGLASACRAPFSRWLGGSHGRQRRWCVSCGRPRPRQTCPTPLEAFVGSPDARGGPLTRHHCGFDWPRRRGQQLTKQSECHRDATDPERFLCAAGLEPATTTHRAVHACFKCSEHVARRCPCVLIDPLMPGRIWWETKARVDSEVSTPLQLLKKPSCLPKVEWWCVRSYITGCRVCSHARRDGGCTMMRACALIQYGAQAAPHRSTTRERCHEARFWLFDRVVS